MAFRTTQENLLSIVALWDAGNTVQEIAAQVHCSVKTARRWVQKYEVGEGYPHLDISSNLPSVCQLYLTSRLYK